MFKCISYINNAQKATYRRLTSRKHRRWEGWRYKTAVINVTQFRSVVCCKIKHDSVTLVLYVRIYDLKRVFYLFSKRDFMFCLRYSSIHATLPHKVTDNAILLELKSPSLSDQPSSWFIQMSINSQTKGFCHLLFLADFPTSPKETYGHDARLNDPSHHNINRIEGPWNR